ncbi:MAG: hypothetical protein AVDCRST_MAG53-3076, partial [uncultured Solirubrobacteraceae bacterium]
AEIGRSGAGQSVRPAGDHRQRAPPRPPDLLRRRMRRTRGGDRQLPGRARRARVRLRLHVRAAGGVARHGEDRGGL